MFVDREREIEISEKTTLAICRKRTGKRAQKLLFGTPQDQDGTSMNPNGLVLNGAFELLASGSVQLQGRLQIFVCLAGAHGCTT